MKQIIVFSVLLLINIWAIIECIRCWILKIDTGGLRFYEPVAFTGYIEISILFIYLIVKEVKEK